MQTSRCVHGCLISKVNEQQASGLRKARNCEGQGFGWVLYISAFQILCAFGLQGILLNCRFQFTRPRVGPEILHFNMHPQWCWFCWSAAHTLSAISKWIVKWPRMQAGDGGEFYDFGPPHQWCCHGGERESEQRCRGSQLCLACPTATYLQ